MYSDRSCLNLEGLFATSPIFLAFFDVLASSSVLTWSFVSFCCFLQYLAVRPYTIRSAIIASFDIIFSFLSCRLNQGECTRHARRCGGGQGLLLLTHLSLVLGIDAPRSENGVF